MLYHLHILHGETELETINARLVSSCCGGESISIGSVCAAELTVKVFGSLALTDEIITAAVQQDGEAETPLGTFRVTTCQQNSGTTTITAYDAAYYALGGEYTPSGSPTTALAVLRDICTQAGLTLDYGGADVAIEGDLTGHTCREMVGYMAALLGCNAVIDRDGKLRLIWFTDSGQTAAPDDYYSGGLSLAGATTLAGVRMTKTVKVTTTSEDGTTTETDQTTVYDAGSGTGTVIAVDNPFATQAIVDAVWAAVGGLGTYRAGSCAMFGGMLTEPGDLISVTDLRGVTSVLPAMTVQLELDGGCKCTVSAVGQSDTVVAANVQGPTGKALSKLEADIARFKDLYANNAEIERAKIEKLIAGEITLESVLHSADYVRIGTGYASAGMAIDFSVKEIVATNFRVSGGNIYAQGGKIAGFKLKQGTAHSTAVQSLTVPEAGGTVTFRPAMTASFSGESFPLSKLWVRPEMAAADIPDESVLSAKIVYADSGGDPIYVSTFSALIYHDVTAGDMMGTLFTLNATYLSACDHVELVITLDAGAKCSVQRQYGAWQALYTGSADTLMGDPDGIYLGTDGISVGEDIALTPDGHATVGELTADGNVGINGNLIFSGVHRRIQWNTRAGNHTVTMRTTGDDTSDVWCILVDNSPSGNNAVLQIDAANPPNSIFRGTATKATKDGSGNTITDTYLKLSGGSLTGALSVDGGLYGASRVHSSGKKDIASGADGCILDAGTIYIAKKTYPSIYFLRNGATTATSYIRETADGTLTVSRNLAIGNSLTVDGFTVPKMQNGSASVSGVTSTHTEFSVTFPKAFSSAPNVQLTPLHNSNGTLQVKLKSVSATGFTADVWCSSTTGITAKIYWLATY